MSDQAANDGLADVNESVNYTTQINDFVKAHMEKYKTSDIEVRSVTENVMKFYSPGSTTLLERVDDWISNAPGDANQKKIAKDLKTFIVNNDVLPDHEILDAGDVVGPKTSLAASGTGEQNTKPFAGPEKLVQGADQLAGALVNSVGNIADKAGAAAGDFLGAIGGALKSVVTAPLGFVNAKLAGNRVNGKTNEALGSVNAIDEIRSNDLPALLKQANALAGLPAGTARDEAVKLFAESHGELSAKIDKTIKSDARLHADKSVDSSFKRSAEEIKEDAKELTGSLEKIGDKAINNLSGDTENINKIKLVQEAMREMLEKALKMIKTLFSGFSKGKSSAPTPSPK